MVAAARSPRGGIKPSQEHPEVFQRNVRFALQLLYRGPKLYWTMH